MKLVILSLAILLFLKFDLHATHAMGSDLTYRCLGPGQFPGTYNYEITFTFYRDCNGINISTNTGSIDITNSCGHPNQTVILNQVIPPTVISPICSAVVSTCNGGSYIGLEEWIFSDTVTLQGECSEWKFAHSESARNSSITTLTPNGSGNLYVFSTLNNLNGLCNNSPTFSNKPITFSCVDQHFCFNHGAYDIDGDSLAFELITPKTGPDPIDTVEYFSSYSATQPVISIPPMTFNSSTGEFCMVPRQPDVSVMAVLVNEYRNGILIGQVERDMQLTIHSCNNILPNISGFNGLPARTTTVCANQQNCFFIRSIDVDTAQSTSISWDQSIPGISLSNSGGIRDTALICWSPNASDTINNPHCFTISVTDDNCPYSGIQVFTYCFNVDVTPNCSIISIDEFEATNLNIKVYPQPAYNEINFEVPDELLGKKLIIQNILGETMFTASIDQKNFSFPVDKIKTPGIYFTIISDRENKIVGVKKILLNR